ncbi:hypothetical protein F3Y22_tig00110204pilonHSYRG00042 [Hibiscus syriacus]|uniref:Uncharacterized protein n=1 Tax=Hibiscus syriacus TaxID=106335 RepID=A0A6A3BGF3_HIBSY|nr:hypothetical protein F3Y22_tig00110204pilonHSYRG00042 [Hibiscus syriacus]
MGNNGEGITRQKEKVVDLYSLVHLWWCWFWVRFAASLRSRNSTNWFADPHVSMLLLPSSIPYHSYTMNYRNRFRIEIILEFHFPFHGISPPWEFTSPLLVSLAQDHCYKRSPLLTLGFRLIVEQKQSRDNPERKQQEFGRIMEERVVMRLGEFRGFGKVLGGKQTGIGGGRRAQLHCRFGWGVCEGFGVFEWRLQVGNSIARRR